MNLLLAMGNPLSALGTIFYFVILPVLLLAGVGYLLQRALGLDIATMTRLNFYFVIPGIVYSSIVKSDVSAGEVLQVVGFGLAMLGGLAAVTLLLARLRKVPRDQRNVLLMTSLFYNSGNIGLPLQRLAFTPLGLEAWASALQVFVMVVQNISNFTIGILLAAGGKGNRLWRENLLHMIKFPPLYVLLAALLTVKIRTILGGRAGEFAVVLQPFWQAINYMGDAMIPIALCTLGAQLAVVKRDGRQYPVRLSVLIRLLGAPLLGLIIVYAMGLRGHLAQFLLISTTTPTAVNCMLLCVAFDNHPDFAARSVFYSTLLAPISITLVIFLSQSGWLPGF